MNELLAFPCQKESKSLNLLHPDHGGLTASLPTYMKAAGHGTEEVCGAGFDLSAPIVDGINSGYIDVVIDQQPFIQGYIPIIQLFLTTYGKRICGYRMGMKDIYDRKPILKPTQYGMIKSKQIAKNLGKF